MITATKVCCKLSLHWTYHTSANFLKSSKVYPGPHDRNWYGWIKSLDYYHLGVIWGQWREVEGKRPLGWEAAVAAYLAKGRHNSTQPLVIRTWPYIEPGETEILVRYLVRFPLQDCRCWGIRGTTWHSHRWTVTDFSSMPCTCLAPLKLSHVRDKDGFPRCTDNKWWRDRLRALCLTTKAPGRGPDSQV